MSSASDPPGSNDPLVSPLGETGEGDDSSVAPTEPVSTGATGAAAPPITPSAEPSAPGRTPSMLGPRRQRSAPERLFVRLIATFGIVGIGVAIAAIMVSSNSQGWIVGLVVSLVSVILAAILWSSRML
jgi:hypothetical protein